MEEVTPPCPPQGGKFRKKKLDGSNACITSSLTVEIFGLIRWTYLLIYDRTGEIVYNY